MYCTVRLMMARDDAYVHGVQSAVGGMKRSEARCTEANKQTYCTVLLRVSGDECEIMRAAQLSSAQFGVYWMALCGAHAAKG